MVVSVPLIILQTDKSPFMLLRQIFEDDRLFNFRTKPNLSIWPTPVYISNSPSSVLFFYKNWNRKKNSISQPQKINKQIWLREKLLTKPNIENFILPSFSRLIAFGRCLLIIVHMILAMPLFFPPQIVIPVNSISDGFVCINIDVYFSPNIFFKFALIMPNWGGNVASTLWITA